MATVYLNGEYTSADHAKVSVFDRGFLFGDGVYEVIPVYEGRCFELEGHLGRLQRSLEGVRIINPRTNAEWSAIIQTLIDQNGGGDQSVYLQVTRGVAPRDHLFPANTTPSVFVMSNPMQLIPDAFKLQGIKCITLPDIRWQRCDIKAITLLANSLLKQQAHEQGAQEALLIKDGHLTEGAASNAYIVKNDVIYTPPKSSELLPGITRDVVLSLAKRAGIELHQQQITEAELHDADEIWISSSTREVLPVTVLDDHPVASGQPGPVWQALIALYQQLKQEQNLG